MAASVLAPSRFCEQQKPDFGGNHARLMVRGGLAEALCADRGVRATRPVAPLSIGPFPNVPVVPR
jgi:hypothetical protein